MRSPGDGSAAAAQERRGAPLGGRPGARVPRSGRARVPTPGGPPVADDATVVSSPRPPGPQAGDRAQGRVYGKQQVGQQPGQAAARGARQPPPGRRPAPAKPPRRRTPCAGDRCSADHRRAILAVLLVTGRGPVLLDRRQAGRHRQGARRLPGPSRRHPGHQLAAGRLRQPQGPVRRPAQEARHRQAARPADRHDDAAAHPGRRRPADPGQPAPRLGGHHPRQGPQQAQRRLRHRRAPSCWSRPSRRSPACASTTTWRSVSPASWTSSTRSAGSRSTCAPP